MGDTGSKFLLFFRTAGRLFRGLVCLLLRQLIFSFPSLGITLCLGGTTPRRLSTEATLTLHRDGQRKNTLFHHRRAGHCRREVHRISLNQLDRQQHQG